MGEAINAQRSGNVGGGGAGGSVSKTDTRSRRVERLIGLIENLDGQQQEHSNNSKENVGDSVRSAIARQLCSLCAEDNQIRAGVLLQLYSLLRKKEWDCRVTAAAAIAAISADIRVVETSSSTSTNKDSGESNALLHLDGFDVSTVLERGSRLTATAGKEYLQWEEEQMKLSPDERLKRARKHLKKRLGIDVGDDANLEGRQNEGVDELVADEDLMTWKNENSQFGPEKASGSGDAGKAVDSRDLLRTMSAREKNRMKRQAKTLASQTDYADRTKRQRTGSSAEMKAVSRNDDAMAEANDLDGTDSLKNLCQQLLDDMLSPRWETRHGSGTCLRDIISKTQKQSRWPWMNSAWVEDCVSRVICVLALDRFGDYSDDEVVAPVREIAGQVFGVALHLISNTNALSRAANMIAQLVIHADHDVKLGGMLGLKYLFAVAKVADASGEVISDILRMTLPTILKILKRMDTAAEFGAESDVQSAGMDALSFVAEDLMRLSPDRNERDIDWLYSILWNNLESLDDLDSISTSTMRLLTAMYSNTRPYYDFGFLLPKLDLLNRACSYLKSPVRSARMESTSLISCVSAIEDYSVARHDQSSLTSASERLIESLFHQLTIEKDGDICEAVARSWKSLIKCKMNTVKDDIISSSGCSFTNYYILQVIVKRLDFFLDVNRWPDFWDVQETESARFRHQMTIANCLAAAICEIDSCEEFDPTISKNIAARLGELFRGRSCISRKFASEVLTSIGENSQISKSVCNVVIEELMKNHDSDDNIYEESFSSLQTLRARAASLCNGANLSMESKRIDGPQSARRLLDELSDSASEQIQILKHQLCLSIDGFNHTNYAFHIMANTALVRAVVSCTHELPNKLTPLISPLMKTIEFEREATKVWIASDSLATLLQRCMKDKRRAGIKVLMKLYNFISNRAIPPNMYIDHERESDFHEKRSQTDRFRYTSGANVIMKSKVNANYMAKILEDRELAFSECLNDEKFASNASTIELESTELVTRLNAEMAIRIVLSTLRNSEANKWISEFWQAVNGSVIDKKATESDAAGAFQTLNVIADIVDWDDENVIVGGSLSDIIERCKSKSPWIRILVARACSALAASSPEKFLPHILNQLHQMMGRNKSDTFCRRGIVAILSEIAENFQAYSFSYIIMLLVPLLKHMADPDDVIRSIATRSFSRLVPYFPLARDAPLPTHLPETFLRNLKSDRRLLVQLLDNTTVEDVKLSFIPVTPLRRYQQEGVNWLEFLRRFGMHGVLADDMGLGKTLQTLCIIAHSMKNEFEKRESPFACLIVCPNTLVRHWAIEATKHIPDNILKPMAIQGNVQERQKQWEQKDYNMVICSYETLRSDIETFSSKHWLYCVLDEGHVVKNPKTRVAAAVRRISKCSSHRLVLSGTPIQNSPLELWGLFEFLMPGFLGSHANFARAYAADINRARSKRADADAIIACEDAAERLHKTVMPFVLRRTKEKVLKDLPPKVVQDIVVDLSPLQQKFLEKYTLDRESKTSNRSDSSSFATFILLRKLATHPALVFDKTSETETEIVRDVLGISKEAVGTQSIGAAMSEIRNINQSAKFTALKQLLLDCGIGQTFDEDSELSLDSLDHMEFSKSCGHRVLVFAQMVQVLDMVEEDLFGKNAKARGGLKGVSWLRLDGRTPGSERVNVAERFNSDASIDVLLLTTQVGSLGLNLTAADTVIFLEHDWNPQRDLQAMDRAHRLGQKRSVSVYRLITRGTIEEEIMSLQRFKVGVAEAVVNQENTSVEKMDTGALLDILTSEQEQSNKSRPKSSLAGGDLNVTQPFSKVIDSLDELWDCSEYAKEFSFAAFTANLKKAAETPDTNVGDES